MNLSAFASKNLSNLFLLLWTSVLPLVSSGLLSYHILQNVQSWENFSYANWLLIALTSIITMALAITPTTFIALLFGYFIGMVGLTLVVPAYLLASALGYIVAARIDGGTFSTTIQQFPKVNQIVTGIQHKSFFFIILCRLSPVLPFAIMNIILSILKVPFFKFLGAGLLGMLPRTIIFVYIGSQADQIMDVLFGNVEADFQQWSFAILLIGTFLGFAWYFKRLLSKWT